jgi:hypothetical protein
MELVEELPPSTLNVPVTYDLTPIVAKLEAAVPRRFGDITKRSPVPTNRRLHVAFEAERGPFRTALHGDTARISATIRYRGRGWYKPPVAPEISASCGTDQQTDNRPRASIALVARVGLTTEWKLHARTRVERIAPTTDTPRDQCRVTAVRIDVTDRVIEAARINLQKSMGIVDRSLAGIDVRSRFEEWWQLLQTPIAITDSLWLVINPLAVRRGPARGTGTTLVANVGLTAAPRIVLGAQPEVTHRALPPLDTASITEGLHVLLEGSVDYDMATGMLQRVLAGRQVRAAGHSLRIRDLRLSGIGGGRLALEVLFEGSTRGRIFFVGTPRYDAETSEVFVPDLDFDVASSHMLVSGLDWLRHDDFRRFLRERARFPVGDVMTEARGKLREGLNRNLSRDVRLSGEVHSVRPIGVHATKRALLVRAHALASAQLVVQSPPKAE